MIPNCDYCDEDADQCSPIDPPPPYCINIEICRTPGFWGTHTGTGKMRSQNITQAVIDYTGGCIEVCGESIGNTDIENDESALESLYVRQRGAPRLQLGRQLTAMVLNCIMSGGGADCTGTSVAGLFAECNMLCATGTSTNPNLTVNQCIRAVDCFNNGGIWYVDDTMTYGQCLPMQNSCHEQPLCNENIGLCFEPPGPAGSSRSCNDATKSNCTLIGPGSANCAEVDECD